MATAGGGDDASSPPPPWHLPSCGFPAAASALAAGWAGPGAWAWVPASPRRTRLGAGWLRLEAPLVAVDDGGAAGAAAAATAAPALQQQQPPRPQRPPCLLWAVVHDDVHALPRLLVRARRGDGAPCGVAEAVSEAEAEVTWGAAPLVCVALLEPAEHPHEPAVAWWGAHGCGAAWALGRLRGGAGGKGSGEEGDAARLMRAWWDLAAGALSPGLRDGWPRVG